MISIFNGTTRTLGSSQKGVYVKIDVAMRKHLHLFPDNLWRVFSFIALHTDEHGWANPGQRYIASKLNINKETVASTLKRLEGVAIDGHRVLARARRRAEAGKFAQNGYVLFPSPEEVAAIGEENERLGFNKGKVKDVAEVEDAEQDALSSEAPCTDDSDTVPCPNEPSTVEPSTDQPSTGHSGRKENQVLRRTSSKKNQVQTNKPLPASAADSVDSGEVGEVVEVPEVAPPVSMDAVEPESLPVAVSDDDAGHEAQEVPPAREESHKGGPGAKWRSAEAIRVLWNEHRGDLPLSRSVNKRRAERVAQHIREFGEEEFVTMFEAATRMVARHPHYLEHRLGIDTLLGESSYQSSKVLKYAEAHDSVGSASGRSDRSDERTTDWTEGLE